MPRRREVQFLRERAQRLREMADEHQTVLSDQLRMIAHELEAQADDVERGGGDGSPYPETEADRIRARLRRAFPGVDIDGTGNHEP